MTRDEYLEQEEKEYVGYDEPFCEDDKIDLFNTYGIAKFSLHDFVYNFKVSNKVYTVIAPYEQDFIKNLIPQFNFKKDSTYIVYQGGKLEELTPLLDEELCTEPSKYVCIDTLSFSDFDFWAKKRLEELYNLEKENQKPCELTKNS